MGIQVEFNPDLALRNISEFKAGNGKIIKIGRNGFNKYKENALALAENRINYFNKQYNFPINRIFIKNQKTRWGSCSNNRNLNFNYKIVFLEPMLSDYIIVHELCHLKEFNHSRNFWNLVSLSIPTYKEARKEIRKYRFF